MTDKDIHDAAELLGRKGGSSTSERKAAASRANGAEGGTAPKCRKDGTVTYWSVYQQQWITSASVPDQELAAMTPESRARVLRHLAHE